MCFCMSRIRGLSLNVGMKGTGWFLHKSSAFRMKSSFLFTLWSWTKMYSGDNLSSLVDFLTWLGNR